MRGALRTTQWPSTSTVRPGFAIAALAIGVLTGCSGDGSPPRSAALVAAPEVAGGAPEGADDTTTSSAPAPSVVPETTSPPPPPPGLGPGDQGPAVLALEQRLSVLKYEVGSVDDVYDSDTAHGVTAFQKVTGQERTGRATDEMVAGLATATEPVPIVPAGGANRVEIDLDRQVLFLFQGSSLFKVLPVSTGSGQRFCSQGYCRRAITPQGSFAIYEQRHGWEKSPLGRLYNSQYFEGGIAIHGSPSVPPEPASHGCVRIPMSAAEWFPSLVSVGTPVYVAGDEGIPAPRPPDVPAVPGADPSVTDVAPPGPPAGSPPAMTYTPPNTSLPAPTTTVRRSLLGVPPPPTAG